MLETSYIGRHPIYEFSVSTVDLPVLIETDQKTSTALDYISSISQSWPIGAVAPWLGSGFGVGLGLGLGLGLGPGTELVHKKQIHDCIKSSRSTPKPRGESIRLYQRQ